MKFFRSSLAFACAVFLNYAAFAAPAPECRVKTLQDEREIDLADTKGKVRYVDFWASWCGPCAESFPFLNEMHDQLSGQGLEIVGVTVDEEKKDALGFLQKKPAKFSIVWDPEGKCPAVYEVKAMPSSYLIDRKGQIRHVHLGFRAGDREEIIRRVKEVLAEP